MKTPGAVRHKIKQVRYRYLKKALEAHLAEIPGNCRFNGAVNHPESGMVHVCLYGASDPEGWNAVVCDDRWEETQRASSCPYFSPRQTKEEIKEEFHTDLASMTLAEVAYHYPDLAALLWVLDEDLEGDPREDENGENETTAEVPSPIPEKEVVDDQPLVTSARGWRLPIPPGLLSFWHHLAKVFA